MTKIGLLGAGMIANIHGEAIVATESEIIAVYDPQKKSEMHFQRNGIVIHAVESMLSWIVQILKQLLLQLQMINTQVLQLLLCEQVRMSFWKNQWRCL